MSELKLTEEVYGFGCGPLSDFCVKWRKLLLT